MTDIIAMHRADLVDAVTAAVAPIKAERDALAAELAQAQTSRAALADGVVEAEARIRELEAALEKYGQHLRGCKREDMLPCSCGFIRATQFTAETETEYGDAVNPQGCREGSRPPIPPDVSSHPVWVPKLDNADECANCGCTWDMHAAGKAWYCPRVFEQPQSDRGAAK